MRLRERDKRDVWLSAQTGMHDDVYAWGEAVPIRAAVYPMEREITPFLYGDGLREKALLLYDGKEKIDVGMGVSLDGSAPAFRIVSLEGWSHVRAVMERMTEGRRTCTADSP